MADVALIAAEVAAVTDGRVVSGNGNQRIERWSIDWTLLRSDLPANPLLERLPGWRRVYKDDTATIFARER